MKNQQFSIVAFILPDSDDGRVITLLILKKIFAKEKRSYPLYCLYRNTSMH
jgi:hypothetical protein